MRELALNCLNGFLLSVVLTLAMEKCAARLGLVDIPTARKNHEGQVPLVGSAIFAAFAVAAMMLEQQPVGFAGFLAGLALLVLLGILDDLVDLPAPIKLVGQIGCVALMLLPGDIIVRTLGTLGHGQPVLLLEWAVPVTIVGAVALINAINLIDGVDGLAGSLSLVALLWFAIAAWMIGVRPELLLALLLGCCLLGFLIFNLRHRWRSSASVFLGDAGSMMLGAVLAFLAISLSQRHGGPSLSPIAALWVCALPVIDTASLAARRLAAGRSPFSSDRWHLHHLMLNAGMTVTEIVAMLAVFNTLLGGIGVLGWYFGVPDDVLLVGLVIPLGLHAWFTLYGWKRLHLRWQVITHTKEPMGGPQLSLK
jgi:UDP-GlcNAc:undecaprenyl-phosphate GlcNAc-1-phosphate transferase